LDKGRQPLIFDTDYGPFIDDVFALGLLVNSPEFDVQYVITTSEQPDLSAKCVAAHLDLAGKASSIPVGAGRTYPPYEERASVCGIPGLVGFALEAECVNVTLPYDDDGLAKMAELIMASDRDDWWYIVVGGQTSVRALIEDYPEAAAKIEVKGFLLFLYCCESF
jgi:inosine-uridine nucleoside N-ribohydrolase